MGGICCIRNFAEGDREKKHEGITEVVKPFDWSYSTDYRGTLKPGSPQFAPSQTSIPLELLKRPDPILFFDEVMLYEDEMADNGITMLSCKVRVMPERMLLLCRFFMRLDNVVVRVRDTRLYIDFSKREVIREYQAKEEKYETVRQVSEKSAVDLNAGCSQGLEAIVCRAGRACTATGSQQDGRADSHCQQDARAAHYQVTQGRSIRIQCLFCVGER